MPPQKLNLFISYADAVREVGKNEALSKISIELAAQLKKVEEEVTEHNSALLKSMAAKLSELATTPPH